MIRQAVLLVGGKGSRLGALAHRTPKPLLEVAPGRAFLDELIENVARQGFSDIILLAGHLGGQVEESYDGRVCRGAAISVIRENEPAGTGGALRRAMGMLEPTFLVLNGDSYFDINLRAFATRSILPMTAHLALRSVPELSRFGSVTLENGQVRAFREKEAGRTGPGLASGGVYLFHRDILRTLPENCSIEFNVFPELAHDQRLTGEILDGYFIDIGLPDTLALAKAELPNITRRPAAYLDRDGVLNCDRGYTFLPSDLRWIQNSRQAVLALNNAGYLVFVVTNQAGVAHGLYGEADVKTFHARMQADLAEIGAHVDAFYYCPFYPDAADGRYSHPSHPDRKPNPGMILRARSEWPVRDSGSFLIGDKETDMEAAARAGVKSFLFVGGDLLKTTQAALVASGWNGIANEEHALTQTPRVA